MIFKNELNRKFLTKDFVQACINMQQELNRLGVEVEATSPHTEERLLLMGEEAASITPYIEAEAERLSGISTDVGVEKEVKNLWDFLKKHKFKFSEDLFSFIKDEYFIGIYDSSFRAIYKNPNAYKTSSYSIADMYLFQWNELFGRDEQINEQLAMTVISAFELGNTNVIDPKVSSHFCYERFSKQMLAGTTYPVLFAPIETVQGSRALITVNHITDIHSKLI